MENTDTLRLESGEYRTLLTPKYQTRKAYFTPEPVVKAAIPGTIMEVLVKERFMSPSVNPSAKTPLWSNFCKG